MVTNTPNSSRCTPASSSKLKRLQAAVPSPTANTGHASREVTPELPTEDKSPSPDSDGGEMQEDEPNSDAETQETAIVPDSAQATPVTSLPGLSPSAIQRMDAMYAQSRKENDPLTPTKLSQDHLQILQNDLLMDEGATFGHMPIPMDDDSITLQSDLTIADLDSDDWKEIAISYGAEARSDGESALDTLAPTSNDSRRRKTSKTSPRKRSRVSSRLETKVLTPSKSAHMNIATATPVRSTGRTVKTYGKRGHRASESTSSEADLVNKSQRTSGTTSGDSSGVEVTTERRAGILRQVTPDGTILPSEYVRTPSKAYNVNEGKGKAVEEAALSSEDDEDFDMSMPLAGSAKKNKGKLPEKRVNGHNRSTRNAKREQEEVDKERFRTPSLSPPRSEPAPFVPLTTATDGKPMSAMEIIAAMRAKNKAPSDDENEEAQHSPAESDSGMQLYSTTDLLKKTTDMQEGDSDSDDLMDTKELLKRAKNAQPRPKKQPSPVASTSATKIEQSDSSKPRKKVKLPTDKATEALNKLYKSRQAEEARGWYGIKDAVRAEAEANTSRRSKSTSPAEVDDADKGNDMSDSDGSDSSSLPDAPPIRSNKDQANSGERPKKARRYSNGQLKRVVGHLTKSNENEGVVEAVKAAQDELDAAQFRAVRRREQAKRQFWKETSEAGLSIEPFKPYDSAGTKGLDHALRQGILDGLADPMTFPVELISSSLTSTTVLLSAVPVAYSLYGLVAHPCTDARLANCVMPGLQTLLQKIPSGGALDVDIDLSSIVESLNAMGAKKDSFTDEMKSSAAIETTPEAVAVDPTNKLTFTQDQRKVATIRIMLILRTLIETKRIEPPQYPSLVILLLRMALDTSDYHMRDAATQTLHQLLAQLDGDVTLLAISKEILELIDPLSFRDRYVVLSFLPLNSQSERSLVRGLCYELLFPKAAKQVTLITGQATLSRLSTIIGDRPASSIFYITSATDDTSLYYAVLLLQDLLTDLSKYLTEDVLSEDPDVCKRAQRFRDNAQRIIFGLTDIDSKLRTDVRSGNPIRNKAKNALARAQHTLEYQLLAAKAKAEKISLQRRLGQRTLAEPVEGKVGQGQIAINSYFTKSNTANSSKSGTPIP